MRQSHENPAKWLPQEGFFHEKKPSYRPDFRPVQNPRKWTKAASPFTKFNATAEKPQNPPCSMLLATPNDPHFPLVISEVKKVVFAKRVTFPELNQLFSLRTGIP
jgi:hypothetical protein